MEVLEKSQGAALRQRRRCMYSRNSITPQKSEKAINFTCAEACLKSKRFPASFYCKQVPSSSTVWQLPAISINSGHSKPLEKWCTLRILTLSKNINKKSHNNSLHIIRHPPIQINASNTLIKSDHLYEILWSCKCTCLTPRNTIPF